MGAFLIRRPLSLPFSSRFARRSGPGGTPEEPRARRGAGVQRQRERGDARGEDLGGGDGRGAENRAALRRRFRWQLCA